MQEKRTDFERKTVYVWEIFKKSYSRLDRDGSAKKKLVLKHLIKRVIGTSDPKCLTAAETVKIITEIKKMELKRLEENKQAVDLLMRSLTPAQREALNKFNPFRDERDELIRSLRKRGAGPTLLARVSGFSRTSIHKILRNKGRH